VKVASAIVQSVILVIVQHSVKVASAIVQSVASVAKIVQSVVSVVKTVQSVASVMTAQNVSLVASDYRRKNDF
jgi:hypothetical protein